MNINVISPEYNEEGRAIRRVRSFVRRQGRLTKRQQDALEQVWSAMGVEFKPEPLNFSVVFSNDNPVVLEIGFGMGTSLVTMALQNPDKNFFGIEVHRPGVGACLAEAAEENVQNLRVMCHDAIEVLDRMIPDNSLHMVQLFFPDPWHKIKHNKRRIVQTPFVQKIARKLAIGGIFHMATDWEPYANHMLRVMNSVKEYQNISEKGGYISRPASRPVTKFEKRGHRLGHGVWDLMFKRVN